MLPMLLAVAALAALAPAQQIVTLSVTGDTTGLDLWNNRSETRVRVGDAPMISFRFAPATPPPIVAQRIAAGLRAANITATSSGGDVRIVTAREGVDFGTNDTGHVAIEAGIDGKPAGALKTSGCTLPTVTFGATGRTAFGGTITVEVDVERPGARGPRIVTHRLQVPFLRDQSSSAINVAIARALVAAGIRNGSVLMHSVLNQIGTHHLGIRVDRDADGFPVRRIAYAPTQQLDMRWMEVHAGREPVFGDTDYGQPWGDVQGQPLILDSQAVNQVGVEVSVDVETRLPNRLCLLVAGAGKTALPLPMFGPGAELLVMPLLTFTAIADGNGDFRFRAPLPQDQALVGAAIRWQAADMTPFGATPRLSPGLTTYLWP